MSSFEYCVSLKITHPNINPNMVTQKLGMEPRWEWMQGEPRINAMGKPLPGHYNKSYWVSEMHKEKKLHSDNIDLEEYISKINKKLKIHADFLREILDGGGYIEYFIGVFGGSQLGILFGPEMMAETADLGICIGLDIYGGGDDE